GTNPLSTTWWASSRRATGKVSQVSTSRSGGGACSAEVWCVDVIRRPYETWRAPGSGTRHDSVMTSGDACAPCAMSQAALASRMSTTNTRVELAGMAPFSWSPYAWSAGTTSSTWLPTFWPAMPFVQPGITPLSGNEVGVPRLHEESNDVPSSRQPAYCTVTVCSLVTSGPSPSISG